MVRSLTRARPARSVGTAGAARAGAASRTGTIPSSTGSSYPVRTNSQAPGSDRNSCSRRSQQISKRRPVDAVFELLDAVDLDHRHPKPVLAFEVVVPVD